METRIRILLLASALTVTSGCATMHRLWPWHRQVDAQVAAQKTDADADASCDAGSDDMACDSPGVPVNRAAARSRRVKMEMDMTQPPPGLTRRPRQACRRSRETERSARAPRSAGQSRAPSGETSDQQDLMQPRMAMGREFPFVQNRAHRDGFAMHDVRQVAGLAEQIVGPNGLVRRGADHVRIIQDNAKSIHCLQLNGS